VSVETRILARMAGLRPALTRRLLVERGVRVPAPDGTDLVTDVYLPRAPGGRPTILIRTPYGRGVPSAPMAAAFAERGYSAVVQSCRGTFGSGGRVDFTCEAGDGRATADWIVGQSWSNGEIGTFGPSYLSFTQWALASTAPPQLKAMAIQVAASARGRSYYPGGSFALDTALTWAYGISTQELTGLARLRANRRQGRALGAAFRHLPLVEADAVAIGHPVPAFREWLRHEGPDDPYWQPLDFARAIPSLGVPVSLVAGWHDYYLPYMLDDHAALVRAGAPVRLTIGNWTHGAPGMGFLGLRQALEWFDVHLLGEGGETSPVRVEVMGGGGWRDLPGWPPDSAASPWHLQAGDGLDPEPPTPSDPDRYRYDPSDPTPALGGTSLSGNAGPQDNRPLEARDDVLVFTGQELDDDLEIIGPVAADLFVSSSLEHTDFFVRLCDVDAGGRSMTVCDGLLRLRPGHPLRDQDGIARIRVDLWPTAHRFARGHRIRLLVASGSHPRFARNPGSGEPLPTATTLVAADQAIHHDPAHPSSILLPVIT
jgi:uncharacterized protein